MKPAKEVAIAYLKEWECRDDVEKWLSPEYIAATIALIRNARNEALEEAASVLEDMERAGSKGWETADAIRCLIEKP